MEEKGELSPKAAKELHRILARFNFVVSCYEDVYNYAKAKQEDKAVVITAACEELKKMENYFLTLNETNDITSDDRVAMTKKLREEFYGFVKNYV